MIELTVESVRINQHTSQRVMILQARDQDRYLLIWIAQAEAYAIAIELQGVGSPRPLTHDVLKNVIEDMGGKVARVQISDLIDDIFYTSIVIDVAGRQVEIDSRPSDAVALALRARAPIFVAESVLERSGRTVDGNEEQKMPSVQEGAPEASEPQRQDEDKSEDV